MECLDLQKTEVCHRKLNACSAYFNQSTQMPVYISYKGMSM